MNFKTYKLAAALSLFLVSSLSGCVQLHTGNDVIDATSAVATGVYQQKKIDKRDAQSKVNDHFPKPVDPKVKAIDAAIEKARNNNFHSSGKA